MTFLSFALSYRSLFVQVSYCASILKQAILPLTCLYYKSVKASHESSLASLGCKQSVVVHVVAGCEMPFSESFSFLYSGGENLSRGPQTGTRGQTNRDSHLIHNPSCAVSSEAPSECFCNGDGGKMCYLALQLPTGDTPP